MIDNNTVESLSRVIDENSKYILKDNSNFQNGKLLLVGPKNSLFLKMVKKKFDEFGLVCDFASDGIKQPYTAMLCDSEKAAEEIKKISKVVDIDNLNTLGMSCVSEAILYLLRYLTDLSGKNVTIVGRGHAVKDLAKELLSRDATVTVAHSKTVDLFYTTRNSDIVVYATPHLTEDIAYDTKVAVVDLSGVVPNPEKFNCRYYNRIGKLTISILLNRFVKKYSQPKYGIRGLN